MTVRRKSIRITPAKLRAQRANARLSKGPRTREGRRRSALNRRRTDLSLLLHAAGGNARDALRLWRDLLAQFWFIKPLFERRSPEFEPSRRLQLRLDWLAWAWWRKLRWIRMGASKEDLAKSDGWIESDLSNFLFEFRVGNQKADYWLRKEFGTDGRLNIAALRERIEARLGAFRELQRAKEEHSVASRTSGSLASEAGCGRPIPEARAPSARAGEDARGRNAESRLPEDERQPQTTLRTPPGVKNSLSNPNCQRLEDVKVKA